MTAPPRFTAPGGWTVTAECRQLRVRRCGLYVGDVTPGRDGKPWAIIRASGYTRTRHNAPDLTAALALLGVAVTELAETREESTA